MNCHDCSEKLSDFLLDELSGRDGVLVQEHLALCAACMATYKELKGTGKALEAVPAMQAVKASSEFGMGVRTAARLEAVKIIESLPPEKRLRVEARAAARRANVKVIKPQQASQRQPSRWSAALPVLLLLGIGTALAILLFPGGVQSRGPVEIGALSISVGQAEQFFMKQGQAWSQVEVGKPARTDEEYATRENGRMRFEADGGGAILMGPSSEVKFRRPERDAQAFVMVLTAGELGAERPPASEGETARRAWIVRTEAGEVAVTAGAQVYVRAARNEQGHQCAVTVRKGKAEVTYWKGKGSETVEAGEEASFWEDPKAAPAKTTPEALVPVWRAELLTDAELARMFESAPRVAERKAAGLVLDFSYGYGHSGGLGDWETSGGPLTQKAGGALTLPAEVRYSFAAPLAAPLAVQLAVAPDTPQETTFALTFLDLEKGRVSVDVDRKKAQLQVREKDYNGVARADFNGQSKVVERVRAETLDAGTELQAQVSTSAGKSRPVAIPKGLWTPGALWISAYRGELILEGIKVRGLVPREWLRKRLVRLP